MSYLREAAGTDFALWTWSSTGGLARDGLEPKANTQTVAAAMGFIAEIRGSRPSFSRDRRSRSRTS
ncbi:MAG: hypothetical protein M3138_08125 [Actinomycetota bacterium]|nr:hypothetical protein [Actinomycetota bacterium]